MNKDVNVPHEKNVKNRIEPDVAHGNCTCISFDGFQGGDASFLNKTTGKEAAVAEENHDDQKTAAKECDNDDDALKGRELVTAVQGHYDEDVVTKRNGRIVLYFN